MKRFLVIGVLAAALAIVGAPKAEAASALQIQFSGINFVYNGSFLCDNGGVACTTAPNAPTFANADQLITMSFILDGNLLGTFGPAQGIGIDFSLPVGALALNVVKNGTLGFFDLYLNGTWALALDVSTWQVLVANNGNPFSLTGSGTISTIISQLLPFGLVIEQPITFAFSANNANGTATNFTAAGTGEVDGPATVVPEPASLLLLGTGLLGLAAAYRRRKV